MMSSFSTLWSVESTDHKAGDALGAGLQVSNLVLLHLFKVRFCRDAVLYSASGKYSQRFIFFLMVRVLQVLFCKL